MSGFKSHLFASTVIAGLGLIAPTVVSAQTPGSPAACKPGETRQADGTCAPAKANAVSEVVVTGSRIHRSEYNSASPIQVLNGDTATLEGLASTSEILASSSLVANVGQVNNQLSGFVVTGGPGANTLNLRGLGANRTLVLVDGHRLGPAGVGGTVFGTDLNTIPASLIDRVEILKDGASSIYGSDAVAGVVNIITKKNLDGELVNAVANVTQHGGGDQYDFNAAIGRVHDRGYWNLAFEYNEQQILRDGQRPGAACASDYVFDPATNNRLDFKINGRFECYNTFTRAFEVPFAPGGNAILIYPQSGVTYPSPSEGNSDKFGNGYPSGFVREDRGGFPQTFPYFDSKGDPFYDRQSLISPVKNFTLFGRAGFDIDANTEFYAGALFNRRESQQIQSRQFFPFIYAGMPNIPASLRWLGVNGTTFGPYLLPIIPAKFDFDQQVNYGDVWAGWRGKFGEHLPLFHGWDWDMFGRISRSDGHYGYDFIYNDRVNAISGFTGVNCDQSFINISQNQPGGQCSTIPGGVPLMNQAELSGNFTPAESKFLFGHEQGETIYDEQEIEASMTGDLFTLPAGKLGAAFGVDFRNSSIDDVPGFNNRNGNLWGQTTAGVTEGTNWVLEEYGEIDAPIFKNEPLIQSLDLQASGRHTQYHLGGSNTTWKVGLNWHINSWLAARGSIGTSFRAPALYELFLANQTSFLPQTSVDPCIHYENSSNANLQANCAAAGVPVNYAGNGSSALITTGGGAGHLQSETSRADTFGVILTPSFIDLSLAVDYTDLVVHNEITTFGAGNIATQCYTSADFPNNPFCTLVTRAGFNAPPAPSGLPQIVTVNNSYVNVATQTERAIDVSVRYRHDFDFGRLQIDGQATWDLENTTQLLPGVPQPSYSGTTFAFKGPEFAGLATARFDHGPWTFQWTTQFVGEGSDSDLLGGTGLSTRYSTTCRVNGGPNNGQVGPCDTLLGPGHTLTVLPVHIKLKNYVEFQSYHSLSVRRSWDTLQVIVGVQNIFDQAPPNVSTGEFRVGTSALNAYTQGYLGRTFFMNIAKKF